MIATGVCHTGIAGYGGIYPRVLGHEGYPAYCNNHAAVTLHANEPNFVLARNPSRVIGGGYFGQSSFASHAPVKISCVANVTKLIKDADELKMYAPLGCGIVTGAGSITPVGLCKPDDVLTVVGLGGVGLAAVCGAKAGQTAWGHAQPQLVTRVPSGSGPRDGSQILDTLPSVHVLDQCLEALRKNGTLLQVGVKPVGATLQPDALTHKVNGRRLVGVIEGDRDPAEAQPELVTWVKDGTLPVDKC